MTMMFYLHVGYAVSIDAMGIVIALGQNPKGAARVPGESLYRWNWTIPLPWWIDPSNIKLALYKMRLRKMQRRAERARSKAFATEIEP